MFGEGIIFHLIANILFALLPNLSYEKKKQKNKVQKAENNNKRRENSLPDIPFDSFYRQQCLHTHMSERAMMMMKVMNPFTYFHTLITSLTHFLLFHMHSKKKKRLKNIFRKFQPPSMMKKKSFKT